MAVTSSNMLATAWKPALAFLCLSREGEEIRFKRNEINELSLESLAREVFFENIF